MQVLSAVIDPTSIRRTAVPPGRLNDVKIPASGALMLVLDVECSGAGTRTFVLGADAQVQVLGATAVRVVARDVTPAVVQALRTSLGDARVTRGHIITADRQVPMRKSKSWSVMLCDVVQIGVKTGKDSRVIFSRDDVRWIRSLGTQVLSFQRAWNKSQPALWVQRPHNSLQSRALASIARAELGIPGVEKIARDAARWVWMPFTYTGYEWCPVPVPVELAQATA